MARYTGPKVRLSRKFGEDIFGNTTKRMQGRNQNVRRRKTSEYGIMLAEKQKAKYTYGVLEKQFRNLFDKAAKASGITGEILLQSLECRLDNVVYRAGFATSRRQARQLVSHGHFELNGRRVDIPSIRVKAGDVITVRPKSTKSGYFTAINDIFGNTTQAPLSWLKGDIKKLKIEITSEPKREEAEAGINEQLIVEYYSR